MTNDDTLQHYLMSTPAAAQWQHIGIRNHHGVNIPLFSLHSNTSCGIGEYPDLLPLIEWCKTVGMDTIQLLPLNDTGIDISPYSALSAYAYNPLHLGLTQLPFVTTNIELTQHISQLQSLNKTQKVNYLEVHKGKDQFLRRYYALYASKLMDTSEYRSFLKRFSWLIGYALFKTLKIHLNWQHWEEWPATWRDPPAHFSQEPPQELKKEVDFHIFLQYLCFQQLEQVKQQASKAGIFIKGDIPILINRESADVWLNRPLFLLDYSAGAPPDMYAQEGQKWGFPLYNWNAIDSQNFKWWIDRLHAAEQCYHIYRIDHIVGFYRIWGIPIELPAKDGLFLPKDKSQWIPQGSKIMRMMLANSQMLPIGEDLGIVPPAVKENLRSLGICGTKVMRWERNWETDKTFIPPEDYIPESMTTVSTHDSETLQLWWSHRPEESNVYALSKKWTWSPELTHDQRLSLLRESHHSGSLFHINLLQEYLALIPDMTWPNPEWERINIPGIILESNWTYRFRPSVQEIVANPELKQAMKQILKK